MKKKTLLLSLAIVCIVAFVSPVFSEMKNELDNFRGIPWGLAPPQNNRNQWGLVKSTPIGGRFQIVYARKDEKLFLGNAEIESVLYFFHRSVGFGDVEITARGKENYELMRKACIENWGKPDNDVRSINKKEDYDTQDTYWVGQRVTAHLNCSRTVNYYTTLSIYIKDYHQYVLKDHEELLQRKKGF